MMIQQDKYKLVLLFFVICVAMIIVFMAGRSSKSNPDNAILKQQLANKDSIISLITRERGLVNEDVKRLEDENSELKTRDSILTYQIANNQKTYKLLNDKLAEIPKRIDDLAHSNDSLRLELSKY